MTFICSYHSVIDRWVGGSPQKSIAKGQAYMFYEMISGLIYAHRVRVCLLSFLHFSAMRFASLYRRERPFP